MFTNFGKYFKKFYKIKQNKTKNQQIQMETNKNYFEKSFDFNKFKSFEVVFN